MIKYRFILPDKREVVVSAHHKGEARGMAKKTLGLKDRLPVGTKIVELKRATLVETPNVADAVKVVEPLDLHPIFNLHLVETYRSSSSNPNRSRAEQ